MSLVIRPAAPADAAAIAALQAESRGESVHGLLADSYPVGAHDADLHPYWQRRLTAPPPGSVVLVATRGGAVAGFVAAGPDAHDPARDLIDSLHVAPAFRGGGIGTALLREAADRLAALGRAPALLRVVEANHHACAVCRALGGVEGATEPRDIGGDRPVPLLAFHWARLEDLAAAARQRLARRLASPLALAATEAPVVSGPGSGADHPVGPSHRARPRRKRRLGDLFGLADYGVNRVELDPGIWSSIPHWHSREDEFVYVLEGELVLVSGDAERVLVPGDCAGFPAGLDRPHHLENRSDGAAVYLEIGSRRPDLDEVDYPGEDLRIARRPDGSRGYVRRDGTPIAGD